MGDARTTALRVRDQRRAHCARAHLPARVRRILLAADTGIEERATLYSSTEYKKIREPAC